MKIVYFTRNGNVDESDGSIHGLSSEGERNAIMKGKYLQRSYPKLRISRGGATECEADQYTSLCLAKSGMPVSVLRRQDLSTFYRKNLQTKFEPYKQQFAHLSNIDMVKKAKTDLPGTIIMNWVGGAAKEIMFTLANAKTGSLTPLVTHAPILSLCAYYFFDDSIYLRTDVPLLEGIFFIHQNGQKLTVIVEFNDHKKYVNYSTSKLVNLYLKIPHLTDY